MVQNHQRIVQKLQRCFRAPFVPEKEGKGPIYYSVLFLKVVLSEEIVFKSESQIFIEVVEVESVVEGDSYCPGPLSFFSGRRNLLSCFP